MAEIVLVRREARPLGVRVRLIAQALARPPGPCARGRSGDVRVVVQTPRDCPDADAGLSCQVVDRDTHADRGGFSETRWWRILLEALPQRYERFLIDCQEFFSPESNARRLVSSARFAMSVFCHMRRLYLSQPDHPPPHTGNPHGRSQARGRLTRSTTAKSPPSATSTSPSTTRNSSSSSAPPAAANRPFSG